MWNGQEHLTRTVMQSTVKITVRVKDSASDTFMMKSQEKPKMISRLYKSITGDKD